MLLKTFGEYYEGHEDDKSKHQTGYKELIGSLTDKFPIGQPISGSSGAVVQWCSGAVVQWCSGAVVQWGSGAVEQCKEQLDPIIREERPRLEATYAFMNSPYVYLR